MLSLPVVVRSVIRLRVAGSHFVKGIERSDLFAGRKILDVDAAVGHVVDPLCEALGPRSKTREVSGPSCHHRNFDALLCNSRRCERCASACCCRADEKLASLHAGSPPLASTVTSAPTQWPTSGTIGHRHGSDYYTLSTVFANRRASAHVDEPSTGPGFIPVSPFS